MRKPSLWAVTGLATLSFAATACGGSSEPTPPAASGTGGAPSSAAAAPVGKVGVILPDAAT